MLPELWIAHVLAFHLAVPEPVTFRVDPGPVGFEGWTAKYEATVQGTTGPTGGWLIRYDRQKYEAASERHVRFVIAHELCHAAYDYNVHWERIDAAEREKREKRADRCAWQIVRDHVLEEK